MTMTRSTRSTGLLSLVLVLVVHASGYSDHLDPPPLVRGRRRRGNRDDYASLHESSPGTTTIASYASFRSDPRRFVGQPQPSKTVSAAAASEETSKEKNQGGQPIRFSPPPPLPPPLPHITAFAASVLSARRRWLSSMTILQTPPQSKINDNIKSSIASDFIMGVGFVIHNFVKILYIIIEKDLILRASFFMMQRFSNLDNSKHIKAIVTCFMETVITWLVVSSILTMVWVMTILSPIILLAEYRYSLKKGTSFSSSEPWLKKLLFDLVTNHYPLVQQHDDNNNNMRRSNLAADSFVFVIIRIMLEEFSFRLVPDKLLRCFWPCLAPSESSITTPENSSKRHSII